MFTAWQTARLGRTERIHGLKHYLEELAPPRRPRQQSAAEMLEILRAIKASKETMN